MRCYLIPNIALLLGVTSALDNGLAAQPPLGWRSWNCFQGNINDAVIRGQLDAMLIERPARRCKAKAGCSMVRTSLLGLGFK